MIRYTVIIPDHIFMSIWRYWYKPLPSGAAPAGNMFQCKIVKLFNGMPNIFGIADDILVIGYDKDGADHDKAVYSLLR